MLDDRNGRGRRGIEAKQSCAALKDFGEQCTGRNILLCDCLCSDHFAKLIELDKFKRKEAAQICRPVDLDWVMIERAVNVRHGAMMLIGDCSHALIVDYVKVYH